MLTLREGPAPNGALPPGMQGAAVILRRRARRLPLGAWTLIAFLLAVAVAVGRRAGGFHDAAMDWDESLYVVMARRWLEGDLPYVAVYDLHPVGLPALIAAATWLLDDGLLAARLTAALAVAGTCAALFFAGARFARDRATGVVAALLYGIHMLRPETLAPNTELYNNFLVTLAAILLFGQAERIRAGRTPRTVPALAAAALLGVGLQIKYVIAPEAAGFCLAFLSCWWRAGAPVRRVFGLAGGLVFAGLTPTLVVAAYFWSQGALQPYLGATIGSNLAYVAHVPDGDEVLHRVFIGLKPIALVAAGGIAALALLGRGAAVRLGPATPLLLRGCALWLLLAAVNVVLPMKFFAHYFWALLPPLCLLAAVLVASLRRPAWRFPVLAQVAAVLLLAAPPLRAIARELVDPADPLLRATEQVTACIREHPAARPGLYVFNWDPILYETTRTPPPTRFVLPGELADYSDSAGVDAPAEIARILAGQPGHIVVARPSYTPFSPEAFALLDTAVAGYELACTVPFRVNVKRTAQAFVYRAPPGIP